MFNVTKVDLWSVPIDDRPGGLVAKLEPMVKNGADLDFLLGRAVGDAPGRGIMFFTPVKGERQLQAAEQIGLQRNDKRYCLQIEGADEPGSIYRILYALKEENLNLEEVSAASVMGQFVAYLAFESAEDADRATRRLARPL